MVHQPITIEVASSAGVTIRSVLYHSGAERLLVVLPGSGYLVSHTHLHLLTMLGMQLGYDVLLVPYGFQVAQTDLQPEMIPALHTESAQAIQQALVYGYTNVTLAGKSLGTPIAATLALQFEAAKRLLLLTPIQRSHTIAPHLPALAIIGTADPAYDPALVVDRPPLYWRVFEHVNHGLLVADDMQASLRVLAEIMRDCEDFLRY